MGAIEQMCREIMGNLPPVSQEDIDRQRAEQAVIDSKLAQQREAEQAEIEQLCDQYDVVAAYKLNYSGLLEHSSGNGETQRTVEHAACLKDLHAGRIMRSSGQLLCGASPGSHGYSVMPSLNISCPRCAKIVATAISLSTCSDSVLSKVDGQWRL